MSRLEDSIDQLYKAFADIAKPQTIEGCPCCIDRKNISTLLSTPLRSISANTLSAYASSAFNTTGDVSDYLYFLPRILELSATDEFVYPNIEISGRAIYSTDLNSWSAIRYDALIEFLTAVIELFTESEDSYNIDSWLCAITKMELNPLPFLKQLENSPLMVLAYFEKNASCLSRGKLCNSFWELPSAGHDIIVQWFKTDPVRKILFDTYGYISD